MADSMQLAKPGLFRFTWLRARKARSQLVLSRRPRRRLGALRWCSRKRRRRRRLLQAQAAGADWREGGSLVRLAAARRPKAAAPSPAPTAAPAPSGPAVLPIPPVRPAGPGRALLLLPHQQGFTFSGICRVTCLYGQVQVFGFTISQGQPAQDVFSPYTHSRLTINADDRSWLMKNFSPLCSIVMLERLKTSTVNFITSHPGLSNVFVQESALTFFRVTNLIDSFGLLLNLSCGNHLSLPAFSFSLEFPAEVMTAWNLNCQFQTPTFQINSEYLALRSVGIRREKKKKGLRLTEGTLSAMEELVSVSCEEVDGCPIILVCGHQDVGKSTFNRYLMNRLLNSIPCVDYLECDLGQTEFTPPGCISLLNITEPIL
ncbi:hypothetical protein MC885_016366, partial [Smutsia gigantea]